MPRPSLQTLTYSSVLHPQDFSKTKPNLTPNILNREVETTVVGHLTKRAMFFPDQHKELEPAGCLHSHLDETFPIPLGAVGHLTLDVFELVSVYTPAGGIAVEPVTVVAIKGRSEVLVLVVRVVRAEINVIAFDSPNVVGATRIDDIDGPDYQLISATKSKHVLQSKLANVLWHGSDNALTSVKMTIKVLRAALLDQSGYARP